MKKFIVLYTADMSAMEQMQKGGQEEAGKAMEAWMAWSKKAGDAVVDLGTPLGMAQNVTADSVSDATTKVAGYSIMQGESIDAITELMQEHPHLQMPSAAIEVHECLSMGM